MPDVDDDDNLHIPLNDLLSSKKKLLFTSVRLPVHVIYQQHYFFLEQNLRFLFLQEIKYTIYLNEILSSHIVHTRFYLNEILSHRS